MNDENNKFLNIKYEDIENANEDLRKLKIERENKKTGEIISKDYIPVSERIRAFRKVYPEGFIEPVIEFEDENSCRFVATIYEYDGGPRLAIARAQEDKNSGIINKTSLIENCETSAIGRALGICGFGIDTDLASAEEVKNAEEQQDYLKNREMTEEQIKIIAMMSPELKDMIRKAYNKDPLNLNYLQAQETINSARKKGLIKTKEEEKLEKVQNEIKTKNEEEVF